MGDSSTDKSDMEGRGESAASAHNQMLYSKDEAIKSLQRDVESLNQNNTTLRAQLGNLEAKYKREVELTTAYRRVIKDLSEDI